LPAECGLPAAEVTPVLIELFTSQGCSSCPPADALLADLSGQAGIVALAWHVDYWNKLGWLDPFASAEWTRRQRRYAQLLKDDVYTPALVVNGVHMVVGSSRAVVLSAMAEPHAFPVRAELRRSEVGLQASIGPRPEGAIVSLVMYDGSRATGVRAGENAGRKLRETNIVRSMIVVESADAGGPISLPGLAPGQGAALLVQDRNLAVLGVSQVRPASAE
jgi:hypothetical protein